MCCACSARACEVCACITHARTCECECTPDLHARKAYGPWRACVSIVCEYCECKCARAQFSCARVHVRVFELTRTCVVCVCVCSIALHSAGLHRAVQYWCLCTRRVRRVHCARDARAWCECASARSRNPGCGKCLCGIESAQPWVRAANVVAVKNVEDVEEDVEELTKTLMWTKMMHLKSSKMIAGARVGRPPVLGSVPLLCRWSFSIGGVEASFI